MKSAEQMRKISDSAAEQIFSQKYTTAWFSAIRKIEYAAEQGQTSTTVYEWQDCNPGEDGIIRISNMIKDELKKKKYQISIELSRGHTFTNYMTAHW